MTFRAQSRRVHPANSLLRSRQHPAPGPSDLQGFRSHELMRQAEMILYPYRQRADPRVQEPSWRLYPTFSYQETRMFRIVVSAFAIALWSMPVSAATSWVQLFADSGTGTNWRELYEHWGTDGKHTIE